MNVSEQFDVIADGLFPEGPVVMADGSVIVVELAAGRVSRCWNGRKETVSNIGGGPIGAAIGPDGALYVCNSGGLDLANHGNATGPGTEGRIERLDLATGRVDRLFEACNGVPLSAPNDLVFDAEGGLWFTDLGKRYGRISEAGGLYHCDPLAGAIRCIHPGALSFNGVGLSPDGSTVPGMVELDSLAVTASDNVCIGTLQQGGISQVTPSGVASRVCSFDDRYVTNIAFGGEDMCDAYITLSLSGRLVRKRWSEPGLKLHFNA